MPRIKVTFADGTVEIFHEEQSFSTIVEIEVNEKRSCSIGEIYSLWFHQHDKLTPSFIELLVNSKFFYDIEKPGVVYSSNSVVKFENI